MPRSIAFRSVNEIVPLPGDTAAQISVKLPGSGQAPAQESQAPLRGQYIIECYGLDGVAKLTDPLNYNSNHAHVYNAIVKACPSLRYRFKVDKVSAAPDGCYYAEDCVSWELSFGSVREDLPQFQIYSNEGQLLQERDRPANPLEGRDIELESLALTARGPNISYQPIPFSMLRTAHDSPQVRVKIDGMAAVCTGLACDYTYESTPSLITAFSVNG